MPQESSSGSSTPTSTGHDDSATGGWSNSLDEDDEHSAINEMSPDSQKPSVPLQKRRRVTRACDECRRKKIKCDGKQPCTHCQVYSYSCTYDQPSNRRRNPAPQYTEALEIRLQKAEALLKTVLPDVDLSTAIGPPLPQTGIPKPSKSQKAVDGNTQELERDSQLEAMIENTGSLDLDDQGFWDFHGHSSGLAFFTRLREKFGNIMPPPDFQTSEWSKSRPALKRIGDLSRSPSGSPRSDNLTSIADLPSKKLGRKLVSNALDYACCLMRFVHQPSFYKMFDRIYTIPQNEWTSEDTRFLALLHAVLALGCLFAPNEKSELEQGGWENATNHGFKYFFACRQLIDITDCRDIYSLQAVMFMVMFLQSSAKLATCYCYIGLALRSCLRMGFHRSIKDRFNPIEQETRKRMFWVIRKMDIYISTILGLPQTVNRDDIDQEFPLEIDDEYITAEGVSPMPRDRISLFAAANAHSSLIEILSKVIKNIYPINAAASSTSGGETSGSYYVSHAKIVELEKELLEWKEKLPAQIKPGAIVPPEIERVQQLLRMAFAHVQLLLYRPFLHYASQSIRSKSQDKRSYACAAAAISVSRNVVHITSNMKQRGLLAGSYWLSMYTTFFAILSLIFYVLENPNDETSAACWKDANEGKETLASLARRSHAADRCHISLTTLFERLPEGLGKPAAQRSTINKKRHAPSPRSTPSLIPVHADKSTNGISSVTRASSFPLTMTASSTQAPIQSPSYKREFTNTYPGQRSSYHETPPSSTNSGPQSPNLQNPSSSFQPQFSLLPTSSFSTNGLPDIGPLMFPSDDPFAYPSIPTSAAIDATGALDPGYSLSGTSTGGQQSPNSSAAAAVAGLFASSSSPSSSAVAAAAAVTNGSPNLAIEAQLYGPMAPYMMSGQQPGGGVAMAPYSSEGGEVAMADVGGFGAGGMYGGPRGQHGGERGTGLTPGPVNMEDLFNGEEWNSFLMDQNGRQPGF